MFPDTLQTEAGKQDSGSGFAWPDKSLLKLGVIAFCCMACEGCMFDWSGIYFRDVVQAPHHLVPLGYTAFMAMMATGRFVGDWLVTKTGAKNVMRLSGCLIVLGLLTAILFPNLYTATIGFLLTGFGVSSIVPMAYGLAGKSKTMAAGNGHSCGIYSWIFRFFIWPSCHRLYCKGRKLKMVICVDSIAWIIYHFSCW
jgi:MFS family permease